ncbi:MAG: hypothetical protein M3Q23_14655 [Actinomycetota bacterium]|nr:hypothetical protein [Actinomycetota bacterium]
MVAAIVALGLTACDGGNATTLPGTVSAPTPSASGLNESRPVKLEAFDPSIAHLFELRCGSIEFM